MARPRFRAAPSSGLGRYGDLPQVGCPYGRHHAPLPRGSAHSEGRGALFQGLCPGPFGHGGPGGG
eukprot:11593643-Alexandrium_andersonii.AAC.1